MPNKEAWPLADQPNRQNHEIRRGGGEQLPDPSHWPISQRWDERATAGTNCIRKPGAGHDASTPGNKRATSNPLDDFQELER